MLFLFYLHTYLTPTPQNNIQIIVTQPKDLNRWMLPGFVVCSLHVYFVLNKVSNFKINLSFFSAAVCETPKEAKGKVKSKTVREVLKKKLCRITCVKLFGVLHFFTTLSSSLALVPSSLSSHSYIGSWNNPDGKVNFHCMDTNDLRILVMTLNLMINI